MSSPLRMALFGGTFDPVHEGHLRIAELAREQAQLDQVIFLPCQQSPHKTTPSTATPMQRLAMLQLAATEPWMRVEDFELHLPPPSYSVDTVRYFLQQQPDVSWHWIMGTDQWDALPQWREAEFLVKHLTFLVLPREKPPIQREGYRMHELRGAHPASSTALRDPQSKHFLDPCWLPRLVHQYILDQKLYQPFSSSPLAIRKRNK